MIFSIYYFVYAKRRQIISDEELRVSFTALIVKFNQRANQNQIKKLAGSSNVRRVMSIRVRPSVNTNNGVNSKSISSRKEVNCHSGRHPEAKVTIIATDSKRISPNPENYDNMSPDEKYGAMIHRVYVNLHAKSTANPSTLPHVATGTATSAAASRANSAYLLHAKFTVHE